MIRSSVRSMAETLVIGGRDFRGRASARESNDAGFENRFQITNFYLTVMKRFSVIVCLQVPVLLSIFAHHKSHSPANAVDLVASSLILKASTP